IWSSTPSSAAIRRRTARRFPRSRDSGLIRCIGPITAKGAHELHGGLHSASLDLDERATGKEIFPRAGYLQLRGDSPAFGLA
ncbi:MAG: hypothetical protein ABL962_12015, partial [Fimbriimonadaceae bacterium]